MFLVALFPREGSVIVDTEIEIEENTDLMQLEAQLTEANNTFPNGTAQVESITLL
ncbi:hypothetical protein PoB_003989200, partial [Plakobranchus ocellatus]